MKNPNPFFRQNNMDKENQTLYMRPNFPVQVKTMEIKKAPVYKNTVVLHYSIQYPHLASFRFSPFVGRLNLYYSQKARDLARYCDTVFFQEAAGLFDESMKKDFPFHAYELLYRFQVSYNENCALSLYFDDARYTGGANGTTLRTADSWNLQEGRSITLTDVFPQPGATETLEQSIDNQIAAQLASGENYYFDDYPQLVAQYFNPKNFYLTDQGPVIFFQEITIAPHSSGVVTFTFPYGEGAEEPSCEPESDKEEGMLPEPASLPFSDGDDPYFVRNRLLMEAIGQTGVFTAKDTACLWAEGVKQRSGALQYAALNKTLKKEYAIMWDISCPNWVTGVSSPWIEHCVVVEKGSPCDSAAQVQIIFGTATSSGPYDKQTVLLCLSMEDGFWRIDKIDCSQTFLETYAGYICPATSSEDAPAQ